MAATFAKAGHPFLFERFHEKVLKPGAFLPNTKVWALSERYKAGTIIVESEKDITNYERHIQRFSIYSRIKRLRNEPAFNRIIEITNVALFSICQRDRSGWR